nr:uncharacterized protein LOC113738257 [Coffea arabica]
MSLAVSHLARELSDHAPLLLSVSTRLDTKPSRSGGFGDIFQTARQKEEEVRLAEVRVESDDSDAARMHLHLAKGQLRVALRVEELFWKQKARHIPTILTDEENDLLEQFPFEVEIRSAVFAMDGESAPGSDGYTGKFFTVAWLLQRPLLHSFLRLGTHRIFLNSARLACVTLLTSNFANFGGSLGPSPSEDHFPTAEWLCSGRLISDNFLLAQELLSNMGRTSRNADVALKLDMSKAYDRVSWIFLTMVLRRFGFREQWIDRIWKLVSNVWFLVLINGPVWVSLSLHEGFVKGTRYPQIIENYGAVSGLEINVQKCGFMVHAKLPSHCVARVRRVTGFGLKSFPVRYLGCPLFVGRRKCLYFMELVQSVISKVSSWRSSFLSHGGRIVLIKHVLSAIPTHLLAASCPPKGVLALVERAMANFLWGSGKVASDIIGLSG